MRAAIYVRVSTASKTAGVFDQDPAMQVEPLKEMVARRGWILAKVYEDRESGSRESRPGLNALMTAARRREFDIILVWKFDRFARSVKQLVNALDEFRSLGIDFLSYREALDTSTAMGKATFSIIAVMAELERDLIRERIVAGVERAKTQGTKSGKAIGRPKRIFPRGRVAELMATGLSLRKAAKVLRIGYGTARRDLSQNPGPDASGSNGGDKAA